MQNYTIIQLFTAILVIFHCLNTYGNDTNIKLSSIQATFDTLNTQALDYIQKDTILALETITKIKTLADRHQDKNIQAHYHYLMAKLRTYQSQYPTALSHLDNSLQLFEQEKDDKGQAQVYNLFGVVQRYLSAYKKAEAYHQKSLAISKAIKDTLGIAKAITNLGIIADYSGDYPQALDYHYKALGICERMKDSLGLSSAYINISVVHYFQKNIEKAIEFQEKATQIDSLTGNTLNLIRGYENLGSFYRQIKKFDKGLFYYEKAKHLNKRYGNRLHVAQSIYNIGTIYDEKGSFEAAKKNYLQALEIYISLNDKFNIIYTKSNIGNIYCKSDDYHSSIPYYLEALELAKEIDSKESILTVSKHLNLTYHLIGHNDKAYLLLKDYHALKDSIFNIQKTEKIKEIEEKYNNAQLEKDNAEQALVLAQKNARIHFYGFLLASTVAVIVFFAFLAYLYRRYWKIEIEQKEELFARNEELSQIIQKQKASLQSPQFFMDKKLQLISGSRPLLLLADIYYIESKNNLIEVVTKDETYREWQRLKNLKALLPSQLFVQIHKSYLVNILQIQNNSADSVTLKNGQQLKGNDHLPQQPQNGTKSTKSGKFHLLKPLFHQIGRFFSQNNSACLPNLSRQNG